MALATAALLLACSAVAGAAGGVDWGDIGGTGTSLDTEYTPVPKESDLWRRRGGAGFGKVSVGTESPTPVSADLFAVASRTRARAFAGGAICRGEAPQGDDESDAAFAARLAACERAPVMYSYKEDAFQNGEWTQVDLPGSDRRGFVGAIAWISSGTALAVGGEGCYPRREATPCPDRPDETGDAAGSARAWLYSDGAWEELPVPADMSGSVALDCAIDPADAGHCIAGGLGQLWQYRDEHFYDRVDAASPPDKLTRGRAFHYRVRDVTFAEHPVFSDNTKALSTRTDTKKSAFATTAGCCGALPSDDVPLLLAFDGATWDALNGEDGTVSDGGVTQWVQTVDQQNQQSGRPVPPDLYSKYKKPGAFEDELRQRGVPVDALHGRQGVSQYATGLDSYYGVWVPRGPDNFISNQSGPPVLVTPGGPARDYEPASTFGGAGSGSGTASLAAPGTIQAEMRLVAGAGHGTATPTWSVGVLRTNGRGIAYGTTLADPNPTSVPIDFNNPGAPDANEIQRTTESPASYRLIRLDSNALNGIDVDDETGTAWAVGDRGALMRLDEANSDAARREPDPAEVGEPSPGLLPDDAPFAEFRAQTVRPGPVPAFAEQPTRPVTGTGLVPVGWPSAGNPTRVRDMELSRDGGEGWAVTGADHQGFVLDHWDGVQWQHCDPIGVPGLVPPDPACEALAPLARADSGFVAMTRIPLEFDDDPTNDDELELIGIAKVAALGTNPFLVWFRNGRWEMDRKTPIPFWGVQGDGAGSSSTITMAFAGPDDGWMSWGAGSNPISDPYHWDGKRWVQCATDQGACGSEDGMLPTVGGPIRFTRAGARIYAYGARSGSPLIISKDPGEEWTSKGGLDPAYSSPLQGVEAPGGTPVDTIVANGPRYVREFATPLISPTGSVTALAVRKESDKYEGWAAGMAGEGGTGSAKSEAMWRLAGDEWTRHTTDDASTEYLPGTGGDVLFAITGGTSPAAVMKPVSRGPLLGFDEKAERWRVQPAPFLSQETFRASQGQVTAVADDGDHGFIAAVLRTSPAPVPKSEDGTRYFRFTGAEPVPVFSDVANPEPGEINSLAGAPDGSLWLAGAGGVVHHYDRMLGWGTRTIPGWNRGRVNTNPREVTAVAVGPDGQGLAIGPQGRIADLSPGGVILNRAAGTLCSRTGDVAPCGTGNDLVAAAVAGDGSALAVGKRLTLLWRPPGGQFSQVARPPGPLATGLTGVSMPSPDHAFVSSDGGHVYAGTLTDGSWHWTSQAVDAEGVLLSRGRSLAAIAVDGAGRGYAVGADGLMLERDSSGTWRRRVLPTSHDLTAVTIADGGVDHGVLIGGAHGLVLTGRGRGFATARPADLSEESTGPVSGLALLPGTGSGHTEAWVAAHSRVAFAASDTQSRLFHYTDAPDEPLLGQDHRARPLPDAPAPREGDFTIAALGKSDCQADGQDFGLPCPEITGTNLLHELVGREIADRLGALSRKAGGPAVALWTGDTIDSPQTKEGAGEGPVKTRAWREQVAERYDRLGLPLFGAIGALDDYGDYRAALAPRPAPWGRGESLSGDLTFEEIGAGGVEDGRPVAQGPAMDTEGARTHYAMDAKRDGDLVARIVFVDTSRGSFTSGEDKQDRYEGSGGQLGWLDKVTCIQGVQPGCTRPAGSRAIVVSTTPTYSYGPASDIATDAAAFESIVFKNRVSLVVSGRLGWNGRYWAIAPGVHSPCPGGTYIPDDQAPSGTAAPCGGPSADPTAATGPAVEQLASSLQGLGAPPPPDPTGTLATTSQTGLVPFVVASGAGGKLGQDADRVGNAASAGYFHGYSLVHLSADGDPRKTVVEQRPLFDWLLITAVQRTLRPGQNVTLRGMGRQPIGTDGVRYGGTRLQRINSAAVTHRYSLVEADPDEPWRPKVQKDNGNPHGYVQLDPSVGSVDPQSGRVTTGRGNHGRVYAVAILSVGDLAATYPMVFEPRRSYVPKLPKLIAAPVIPQIRVLGFSAQTLQAPPGAAPPSTPPPVTSNIAVPSPPVMPSFPDASPPPIAPPVPPAAPAPPAAKQAVPLDLSIQVAGISVPPMPGVTAQPTPPVQPAPPAGARREAKQRQAATAKSEEAAQQADDQRAMAGDLSTQPPDGVASATRRDRVRATGGSFTAVDRSHQPSAWVTGLEWGGGISLMALALALGFTGVRPTPRRRQPVVPAPAWTRRRR